MATGGRTSKSGVVSVPQELKLKLDPETDSLSLLSILRAFDGPITEERAWAVLHQAAKTALQCFTSAMSPLNKTDTSVVCPVTDASQLWIHRDGTVHSSSFLVSAQEIQQGEGRTVVDSQSQLVWGLGCTLFEALDYGNKREESNVLSPDLELLIDLMTLVDCGGGESHSAEDEGIERDSGEGEYPDALHLDHHREDGQTAGGTAVSTTPSLIVAAAAAASAPGTAVTSLAYVMDRCRMQMSSSTSAGQADTHFRAVCRALVAETLEFSDFLVKVSSAPENWQELRSKPELHCSELTGLHLADWAKLWVQVIRQLRTGVKLKATHLMDSEGGGGQYRRKPIEYELTPYEMMMDDIRSRRYKLRQVMVDGTIPPRVKKDAHAVILEFIRSRPPLRKASERKLAPPARRVSTPVELLMESIRQHPGRKELRPTRSLMVTKQEGSAASTIKRRLVKADFDTLLNFNQEDEDDMEEIPTTRRSSLHEAEFRPAEQVFNGDLHHHHQTPVIYRNQQRTSGTTLSSPGSSRRHSMMAAISRTQSTPAFPKSQSHNSHLSSYTASTNQDRRIRLHPAHLSGGESGSLPCSSGPSSSSGSSSVSSSSIPGSPSGSPVHHHHHPHLQDDFLRSEAFKTEVQGKLVTLEELVHMRRVLTAASVENLPLDSTIKDDVESGKVCFVCRKTRLSIFRNWWHGCKICRRTVCSKCCTKIRIPAVPFDSVAVSELYCSSSGQSSLLHPPTENHAPATTSTSPGLLSSWKLPQFRISSPGGSILSSKTSESSGAVLAASSNSSSGAGSSPSTSPVFPRNNNISESMTGGSGGNHRKQTLAGVGQRFLHQALSRHVSLSTNTTPVRNPLTAQASLNANSGARSVGLESRKSSSSNCGNDCYVCRDCQSLIEHINYHPVHTLQPRDHDEQQVQQLSLP